jgi:hypothetical protein
MCPKPVLNMLTRLRKVRLLRPSWRLTGGEWVRYEREGRKPYDGTARPGHAALGTHAGG